MTDLSPEQATEALHRAIIDHARAYDLTDGDELLSDWAIVSTWQPVEADGCSRYLTHFERHEHTPFHIALGLFEAGSQLVREMGSPQEDDS